MPPPPSPYLLDYPSLLFLPFVQCLHSVLEHFSALTFPDFTNRQVRTILQINQPPTGFGSFLEYIDSGNNRFGRLYLAFPDSSFGHHVTVIVLDTGLALWLSYNKDNLRLSGRALINFDRSQPILAQVVYYLSTRPTPTNYASASTFSAYTNFRFLNLGYFRARFD